MFASLAPARRRLVLAVLGAFTVTVLAAVAFIVVRRTSSNDPARPVSQATVGPVLLVPGYGGGTSGLNHLAAALRAAGREVSVVTLAGEGTGDLTTQARVLAAAVTVARVRTGASSVDVVGYSAGGVVARLWVRDFGGAVQARRVVTLGAPHHGTDVAALAAGLGGGCPPACEQLVPDSDLLRRLNQGDETPGGPAFVSIWSAQDEVVVPADSARLDGALDIVVQQVCADAQVGHGQLPTSRLVQRMVLMELSGPAPAALSRADCTRLSS
ncbi:MAG: lipase [bacterium]